MQRNRRAIESLFPGRAAHVMTLEESLAWGVTAGGLRPQCKGSNAHKAKLLFTTVMLEALQHGEHGVGEGRSEGPHCPKVRALRGLELLK